ncbi:MAG: hypothetical protein MJZ37_01165 [Bacilli bacterium]|nr:hypothetical protein [Bacilli bacterium]
MTETGKRLLSHLPPKINRQGEIVSALFANEEETGALEKLFAYGETVKKAYSGEKDVYKMDGDLLDQVMEFFSFFERFYEETDASFIKRNKSILVRNGDVTFGTTWNVKHVFEYYFPKAKIFLLENVGRWEDNILINSNFESIVPEEVAKWNLSGSEISESGSFSGAKGVSFTSNNGTVSQNAVVEKDNIYFVTCMVKGNVSFLVKGASGDLKHLYSIGEAMGNESGQTRSVSNGDWNFVQLFFKADKTETITVTVQGTLGSCVDLVTLDQKKKFPCFVVYVWFDQVTIGGKTLHLSQSGEDPIPGLNYEKENYFGKSFFSGTSGRNLGAEIYQDILEMVKSAGTAADIVLLTRETE